MKQLKYLFLLLMIFFPFGELLRWNIVEDIVVKPLDITAGLITIVYLYDVIRYKKPIPSFALKVGAFALAGLFCLVFNSYWLENMQFFAASLYLLRWISYGGVLIAFYSFDNAFKKSIIPVLLLQGFIIVLFGFVQYIFFQNLKPLMYQGWDDHLYRIFSVFFDPNFAAAFYTLFITFLAGLLWNRYQQKDAEKYKKKLLVGVSCTILALLLTFSRSGIVMFLTSTIVFLFLIKRQQYIKFVIGGIILFMVIISPWYKLENVNPFRTTSVYARLANYSTALEIIRENPVFGVGFNAYRYAQEKKNPSYIINDIPDHAGAGVDNSFLFVLATTGIVGFGVYLSLWLTLLKIAYKRYREEKNMYAIIFLASAAGLFINAFFVNSLFFTAIIVWMWILFGLIPLGKKK